MRIVCPSCNAQYEIDVSLLPDEGREVQCSACSHIWFQSGAPAATTPESVTRSPPARQDTSTQATPADQEITGARATADTAQEIYDPDPALEEDTAPETDEDQPPGARQPQPVDAKVLDILRDEAEYEAQQRAREASGLETQPELGLLGAAPWPSKSDMSGDDEDTRARVKDSSSKTAAPAFPDIDDISESLEPMGSKRDRNSASEVPATGEEQKRSFLRGLMLPITLALIIVALYLAAPAIIGAVPASAPVLTGYVNAIDGLRNAIVGLLGS